MKKILSLAVLCFSMSLCAIAQDFQGPRQGGQRGPRRQMDAVVDTAVINHMNLDAAVLQKVYDLQKGKQEAMKEQMKGSRPGRGQRMSEEERNAFQDKMKAFNAQYRKELRAILGDECYINYLEKMLDQRNAFRPGNMRQGQRGQMGGQPGGFQGGSGFGGGFDNE